MLGLKVSEFVFESFKSGFSIFYSSLALPNLNPLYVVLLNGLCSFPCALVRFPVQMGKREALHPNEVPG